MFSEVRELESLAKSLSLLERLQWSKSVENAFFASDASRLPEPDYAIDALVVEKAGKSLIALQARVDRQSAVGELVYRTAESYRVGYALLESVGTRRFYDLSVSQYGGATTTALDRDTTNLDMARHIMARLGDRDHPQAAGVDGDALRIRLATRVSKEQPELAVEFTFANALSAKVVAGVKRVRIRDGARFSPSEVRSLYVHEIETHLLTAQNGAEQPELPFLRSGGPRSTTTQEGLAVFAELYDHSLSDARLRRIARRVVLVGLAEDGASFIDVYRWLLAQGETPSDAYSDCSRIFRGGVLAGGAPFTKDACYLAGLVNVYNTLRRIVCDQQRATLIDLVSGRVCLEDLDLLGQLRAEGTLKPAKFLPGWLHHWDGLVAYFAFTSFLNEIDFAASTSAQPVTA